MLNNFVLAAKAVEAKGGWVSFEWPPSAERWKTKTVQQLINWLGFYVEIDGCAVGVTSRNGEKMKKPFAFTTNSPILAKELEKHRCTRDHHHVPC